MVIGAGAGGVSNTVSQQLKEARVAEQLAVASEKGKEMGAKGWGFLKSAYAVAASQVETLARDNGYKVDLGTYQRLQPSAEGLCILS